MTISKPFFVRPLSLGNLAGGNALDSNPVSHLDRREQLGLTWKSSGNSNLWVRGDFGSAQAVDFLSVIGANALSGTKIRLRLGDSQAEVDGTADYDSTAIDFISPAISRADGLYHSHLELPSTYTKRWWRIDITGHTGDFEAAAIVLGKKITPSHFYNWDYEYGVEDLGSADVNRFGVFDGVPGKILRTLAFTLAWQSQAEFETSFRPMMEELGETGIVYFCMKPDAETWRQANSYMGPMKKPGYARGTRRPGYTQDFQIRSLI